MEINKNLTEINIIYQNHVAENQQLEEELTAETKESQ